MTKKSWKDKTPEELRQYHREYYHRNIERKKALRSVYNKKTGYCSYHKYEKTKKGFLMRKYRNMQSRVTGIQKKKAHLYKDLYLLPREQYYESRSG
jgi:hypothetical protein